MTENNIANQDNGSGITSDNTNFSPKITDLERNIEFSNENTEEICKIEPIFETKNCSKSLLTKAESRPVSEIDNKSFDENSLENFKVLSEKEDIALFSRLFPGVNPETVKNDRLFKLFASGKDKNAPLTSIYTDYLAMVSEITSEVRAKSEFEQRAALSSPGSLASSEPYDDGFYTKEQVLKMSREQIAQNYEKIRKSQQKW